MPNHTDNPRGALLSAQTLAQGAAIAALPDPARTIVLASLQVRASGTEPLPDTEAETFGEDQAAELYLAARAAIDDVDALEILRADPFEAQNMATHSVQFDRLMCPLNYAWFCKQHPADQPLDTSDVYPFVGLIQGGPGTSSWHAPGYTIGDVLALAEQHAEEGLALVAVWDLRTGTPVAPDFVVALTVHVQAYSAPQAFAHVVERIEDLDAEVVADGDTFPRVHHLHAAGPFYGPEHGDIESVESVPQLRRSADVAEPLREAAER